MASIAIKQQLDRSSQTEVHIRTPVTGPQMYKIGQLETNLADPAIAHIRHQQLLQQKDLTQPAHSYDAAPQASSATFAPAEAVRQPTKQEMAPSTHRQAEKDSHLFTNQKQAQIPVQYAVAATTPGGSVTVDAVSAEELKQNLIAAEKFFMEKARQENTAGNTEFAQELLAGAQYTGKCLKVFGQSTATQFTKDTIELLMHSPIAEMLQIGQQQPSVAPHEAEQKYKDMAQELCAEAGCKTGSILSQIYVAAMTHGVGKAVQSFPPIKPTPQAVAIGADGIAVATVTDTVVDATQVAGAGKITAGLTLMNGQQGSDEIDSHDQVPQQQQDRVNERVAAESTVYKVDSTAKYSPPVKSSELGMSKTVEQHKLDLATKGPRKGEPARPYMIKGTNLIVDEIMAAAIPAKDKFVPNGLKWEVAGSFDGTKGTWELVVDLDRKEIIHFLFNSIAR